MSTTIRPYKFNVQKVGPEEYVWVLESSNGTVMAICQHPYKTVSAAIEGCDKIMDNAKRAEIEIEGVPIEEYAGEDDGSDRAQVAFLHSRACAARHCCCSASPKGQPRAASTARA